MFNFNLPNISNISNLGQEKDTKKVKSYLYQLTEQLRYVLNNIDVENLSPDIAKQYKQTANVAEAFATLEEAVNQTAGSTKESLRENYETLAAVIASTANEITQAYTSAIEQSDEQISTRLEEEYTLKTETENLNQKFESQFKQTAQEMLAIFGQIYEGDTDSLGEFSSTFNSYIRFSYDGIEIGKDELLTMTLVLKNDTIVFKKNGIELGEWDGESLYPGNIFIDSDHRIQHGNFAWIARGRGNYSLLKVR